MTPAGYIKIKYVFSNGEFKSEVVEHGPGTGCNNENDKLVLAETDSMIGKTETTGLTAEGQRKRMENPMANVPQTETPFGGGGPFGPGSSPPAEKGKKLDLGFAS